MTPTPSLESLCDSDRIGFGGSQDANVEPLGDFNTFPFQHHETSYF